MQYLWGEWKRKREWNRQTAAPSKSRERAVRPPNGAEQDRNRDQLARTTLSCPKFCLGNSRGASLRPFGKLYESLRQFVLRPVLHGGTRWPQSWRVRQLRAPIRPFVHVTSTLHVGTR